MGIREVGGRDPNERPDNQKHPEEHLRGGGSQLDIGYRAPEEETKADTA
jgi:hypothetical protein